ncbi:zinc-dependent alcohol dehydrogenase family protein [Pseudonocardia endophytica]|uniref:NADPH:quinone reductase-like Zn-dependent oxidoreductase n=1 Tax=Pseudonocardia endophytica TaxID=401976 RepID=A0A4R1HRU1_PSEEN|nr:zinc-dependent alcohol dehydrogenase family protein [Pseudonocardia endophytica]TCK22529.1 NADPH:quinone reductase-like Zn-dependent oxidoreductase [Pseudonocardia endophytica]
MVATVRFHELGGPEVLRIEDLPVRAPGPGEVRIRVDAIGLNRAEVNFRRGTYVEDARLPAGLGTECSGTVLETGPSVGRWTPGDAVSVLPAFSQNDHPVYAEEAVVPASALVARPDGLDAVEAATIWMPYLAVYGMTQHVVRTRPGDRWVVTSAANSVGVAALRAARHAGAVVVATVAGPEHVDAVRAAGADAVVVTSGADDLVTAVRDGLGAGADLVLDADGGPQVADLVRACAPGGVVIVHGGLSGQSTPLPGGTYAPVWLRRFHLHEVTGDPDALRRAEHWVRSGLASGAFAPMVDRVFAFDDVAAAHEYVDSPDRAPGKPVLCPPRPAGSAGDRPPGVR